MSFVVFSLPRSRSTWLSLFLSYGGNTIGHDIGVDCKTPQDFLDRLGDGTCETGAAFAWRAIRRARPDCKFVVVYRPAQEVCASLERFGLTGFWPEMQKRLFDMDEIALQPGTLMVNYDDLSIPTVCADLFYFCLGEDMPLAWLERFDGLNIQVDIAKQLDKLRRNHEDLEALKDGLRRSA